MNKSNPEYVNIYADYQVSHKTLEAMASAADYKTLVCQKVGGQRRTPRSYYEAVQTWRRPRKAPILIMLSRFVEFCRLRGDV